VAGLVCKVVVMSRRGGWNGLDDGGQLRLTPITIPSLAARLRRYKLQLRGGWIGKAPNTGAPPPSSTGRCHRAVGIHLFAKYLHNILTIYVRVSYGACGILRLDLEQALARRKKGIKNGWLNIFITSTTFKSSHMNNEKQCRAELEFGDICTKCTG
jgi:hypothetical protein